MALFVIFLGFDVSIVSGSLTLGIMCLPVIITSTRESLLAIPNHFSPEDATVTFDIKILISQKKM